MTNNDDRPGRNGPSGQSEAANRHHAQKRRGRRDAGKQAGKPAGPKGPGGKFAKRPPVEREENSRLFLYGLHTVRHALDNPERIRLGLYVTPNALTRLGGAESLPEGLAVHDTYPKELDRMVGSEAVHQGCVLEVEPLAPMSLEQISASPLLLVLDQVTDPHNAGAILRSAVAMKAGAVITTSRHSPAETGVLAKSASGALDLVNHIQVRNLAEALEELKSLGYQTIGLDSEGADILENSISGTKVALVMGSEGKGLRQKTRETCDTLARIDMPGEIKSLNVSNAAVLGLYIVNRHLGR